MTRYQREIMPPVARLPMAQQRFDLVSETGRVLPRERRSDRLWRLFAFAPAIFLTLAMGWAIARNLNDNGVSLVESGVLVLMGLTFVWLSLAANTAVLGAIRHFFLPSPQKHSGENNIALDVALLTPIYNETPWDVFGNANAMVSDLLRSDAQDRYALFVLSDTNDPEIASMEEKAFADLQQRAGGNVSVFYRRRAENKDKKIGNLNDWIENWGAAYDAMIVLDADSLMSAAAITQLTRALARDPEAGLIQSFPTLIGARRLFGRIQQFSNTTYGWLLAEGMATWAQREGNYWGHNAIIRTRAFAQSARLPYLRGIKNNKKLILSHDFVEAGLLRRAGWAVRFLPRIGGSYEESPQTLIDYIVRDRRWCQGNLQHLRVLAARGFHPITRLHLLQGAVAFLMSPAWLAVILLWAFVGVSVEIEREYFSNANPLQPIWPSAAPAPAAWAFLFIIYGMLLLPKLLATFFLGLRPRTRYVYGHRTRFWLIAMTEIGLSIAYAPILMVQHSLAVCFALMGKQAQWAPQRRDGANYSWRSILKFHAIETFLGWALLGSWALGQVSWLLMPIGASLAFSTFLSRFSGWRVADASFAGVFRLETPQSLVPPRIFEAAQAERSRIKANLTEHSGGSRSDIAAQ